jgi:hypothetical protein
MVKYLLSTNLYIVDTTAQRKTYTASLYDTTIINNSGTSLAIASSSKHLFYNGFISRLQKTNLIQGSSKADDRLTAM